jgi:hypothetical protein
MGHFPDSVKRPVLTRSFEESLIAVFKVWLAAKIWLRTARKITYSVTETRAEANRLQFLEERLLRFVTGWCTTSNPVLEEQRE